jgi:hypothetical protein
MENVMKEFSVYQLQGTDLRDERFELGFGKDPKALAEKLFDTWKYTLVAKITAPDLEGVFQIGNIGPESHINRIADRMASVSVGDIVEDPASRKTYLVANFGFTELFA